MPTLTLNQGTPNPFTVNLPNEGSFFRTEDIDKIFRIDNGQQIAYNLRPGSDPRNPDVPQGININSLPQFNGADVQSVISDPSKYAQAYKGASAPVNPPGTTTQTFTTPSGVKVQAPGQTNVPATSPQMPQAPARPVTSQTGTPAPVGSTERTNQLLGGQYFDPNTGSQIKPFQPPSAGSNPPTEPPQTQQNAPGSTQTQNPSEGTANEPSYDQIVQRTIDTFRKNGIAPPDPNSSPVKAVMDTYKQFHEQMGLDTIKQHYDYLQKKYADLQNEKNDKVSNVNNNPWLSEGQRAREVRSVESKYEARTSALTNEMKLTESMYNQGKQEAEFWAGKGLEIAHQQQNLNESMIKAAIGEADKELAARRQLKNQGDIESRFERSQAAIEKRFHELHNESTNKTAQVEAQKKISGYLGGKKGTDGYVDSKVFQQARAAWVADGFSSKDFDSIFSGYVNPSRSQEYGVNFQAKPFQNQ